ncbi:MAG: tripartite tricarboxylate transporter TctB family protein [Lawsonibacter sp.]|nr:tripartite tricarboxylate transporter TctB family protein [Lawsonibacter sp.]
MDGKEEKTVWKRLNNQEFLGGAVMLGIFLGVKALSMRLPGKVSAYPIFMSNVGLLLAVLLFARCLFRLCKGTLNPRPAFQRDDGTMVRYTLSVILLVAYAVLFQLAGCILSSFVFMLSFSQLFGQKRNWKLGLLVSAGFTAVIYLGFGVFLGVPLPTLFL